MTAEHRADRIWHHEMETCEGIREHAERIVKLEELCADMWALSNMRCRDCDRWVQLSVNVGTCRDHYCVRRREIEDRMRSREVPT